jgi:hypothetical protein
VPVAAQTGLPIKCRVTRVISSRKGTIAMARWSSNSFSAVSFAAAVNLCCQRSKRLNQTIAKSAEVMVINWMVCVETTRFIEPWTATTESK